MPGPPQARLADMHAGPACTVTGPMPIIPPCAITVLVGKKPAARMGDMCVGVMLSPVGVPIPAPPHPIAKGSMTVMIQKQPAARIGDICAMGGTIILGEFTVLTGG
jgi:uncharacterized Zn-binding protein involved in type VI secretion